MVGGVEELSIEQLASSISTYKEQLEQVRQLLSEDPRNSEYADMEKELKEVINPYFNHLFCVIKSFHLCCGFVLLVSLSLSEIH
jgi:hypothetical protein|uniref:AT2G02570 protein n=1 Tax=Arabidopsis thaliana TaxID=3702 RepID=C0Z2R8_ARATH|nr:AT2G02570 [Arabidopsis thaliana]